MRHLVLLSVGGALAGCTLGPTSLDPDFEDTLTRKGGCADLYTFAVNADDTILLEVDVDGPLAAAGGVDTSTTTALPDAAFAVTVGVGRNVSDAACDDLIINGGPEIDDAWTATSGEVLLDIVHDLDGNATADVTLSDVVLESPDADAVKVESFHWEDISVGWFPG